MLDDQAKIIIGIAFIALLIVLPFAMSVRDRLMQGALDTSFIQGSTWAAVVFGGCLAVVAGHTGVNKDPVTGSLYTVAFYVGVIGVFVLPVLLLIIAAYVFGYLFWLMGGRKRTLRTDGPSEKIISEPPKGTFGKRNRPPE